MIIFLFVFLFVITNVFLKCNFMKKILLIATALLMIVFEAKTQNIKDSVPKTLKVYKLGEVTVSDKKIKNIISKSEMQKLNTANVAESVNTLPSVTMVNIGAKNETTIYLRGFDLKSVPVFADGIPIYVPYDGYLDLARFTNADLSKIEVSKGYSSILYGANTIGGSINLISSKPTEKFEIYFNSGILSGKGYKTNISIGSNLGKFYIQANFSKFKKEFYNLSNNFDTTINETDLERDNSYRDDNKASIKIGYTPNNTDEYSVNYIYQHGAKGTPIYLGKDENIRVRYWQWPNWDKQSLYFISKTKIAQKSYLKTRVFYDKFINTLKSYDDNTYSTQTRPYAFTSFYNDYSVGANFEAGSEFLKNNVLKIAGHYKFDMHRENNEGEPVRHFTDNTFSFGVEDILYVGLLKIIPGFSFNYRNSVTAEDYDSKNNLISEYPANKNSTINVQVAAYYNINKNINISLTTARKTRFATMKDRYSYRMGRSLPNPDLVSEAAINYELASQIKFTDKVSFNPAIFYSQIFNTIQAVDNVLPNISQMQNTGKSRFYGCDFSLNIKLLSNLRFNTNYTYIKRHNISNPEILFTDVPNHKIFAYIDYSLFKNFELVISTEYNTDRYSTSYGTVSPGFMLLNSQISYSFTKYFKTEIGINNILDKNYTLFEGYPEQGRNFYFNLTIMLSK